MAPVPGDHRTAPGGPGREDSELTMHYLNRAGTDRSALIVLLLLPLLPIMLLTAGCSRDAGPAGDIATRFPAARRIVAIGDLHGDLDATRRALRLAGAIDEEALFYLRSRGVPEGAATDLLVLAFLAEAIDEIEAEELREDILARLEGWLDRHRG